MIGQTAVSSSLDELDLGDAGVRERLEPGEMVVAGMPERDELVRP